MPSVRFEKEFLGEIKSVSFSTGTKTKFVEQEILAFKVNTGVYKTTKIHFFNPPPPPSIIIFFIRIRECFINIQKPTKNVLMLTMHSLLYKIYTTIYGCQI